MGCNGDKGLKEIDDNLKLDIIPISDKLNKNEKINLLESNNKHLTKCSSYYNMQMPTKNNNNSDFIDKLFPFQTFSPELEEQFRIENENIVWKSAKEIFGKKVKIFGDTTSVKDIKLGPAGNSYFVSAISALAEFPNIVSQLFRTKTLPQEGEPIEVCIRIEGKWTIVLLDDKFMVNKETNLPIFSTSPSKNIWGMILEKAWAKISGGYENIIYGTSNEIFECFTPFRVIEINIKKIEKEAFWDYINSSFKLNCMMTSTIKENISEFESMGIINDHSFTIFENKGEKNKNNLRFIKLRNPIGDNDAFKNAINEELIENLGIQNFEENGIFLMEYEKFIKSFSILNICIPSADLYSHLIEVPKEKANDFGIIRISIEEECNLSISIIPNSCRFHVDLNPDKDIFKNLILIQIFRNKGKANYFSSSLNETLFTIVKPGEYICLYNVDFKTAEIKEQSYKINISCTKPFKFYLDEPDNKFELLKYIMIPKIEEIEKYAKRLKEDFVVFTGNRFELTSFGYYYMKNNKSEIKYVKPSVYLKNFKSIEGEFPTCLKMNKNSLFFFLFNRIKLKSTYQTGANVGFFRNEFPGADEPKSYKNLPEKYCKEIEYEKKEFDYEFSSFH